MFGTKGLSGDTVMQTQATADSKEGNLSIQKQVLQGFDVSVPNGGLILTIVTILWVACDLYYYRLVAASCV